MFLLCIFHNAYAEEKFVIEDIVLEGLQRVDPGSIYGYLPFEVGDTFDASITPQIIKTLYKSKFFDDIIIKRRLAQKISFLKQESISKTPSEEEIKEYYRNHTEDYFVESTYTFSHIYFSKDNQAKPRSIEALDSIRQGKEPSSFGDPFLLGKNFSIKTSKELKRSFGDQFSDSIKNLEIKKWDGPISSEYGEHLIFLNSYTDSYLPKLSQVRGIVVNDILAREQSQSTAKYLEELRKEYEIQILSDLNVQSD